MSEINCLGMDIGYSSLKGSVYSSKSKETRDFMKPSGAVPRSKLPSAISSRGQTDLYCLIEGELWATGVEPSRLENYARELHDNYIDTNEYLALFYASLLESDAKTIDVLVTGLPVKHSKDINFKNRLVDKFTGVHQITENFAVEVKKVIVTDQPVGAFFDVITSETTDEKLLNVVSSGNALVFDPGFFSVDWVTIKEGAILASSSATSTQAMSVLIEDVNDHIATLFGKTPGIDKIERALREGKKEVMFRGEPLDLSEMLEKSAMKITEDSLKNAHSSTRKLNEIDVVILTGGGSYLFKSAVEQRFPHAQVIIPENPTMSNAKGFLRKAMLESGVDI